jgi:hypothetical protein
VLPATAAAHILPLEKTCFRASAMLLQIALKQSYSSGRGQGHFKGSNCRFLLQRDLIALQWRDRLRIRTS